MIRANINEQVPITVSLLDDSSGEMVGGESVTYEAREHSSDPLFPAYMSGTLDESEHTTGVYHKLLAFPEPGHFVVYVTCSGYSSDAENVWVDNDLTTSGIADAVWDEQHSLHTTSGTFGDTLFDMSSNIDSIIVKLPIGDIAGAGEYTTVLNNIETYILRCLGLTQENFFIDQNTYITYQGIKLLASGRIRTYSNAGSVGTSSNVIATYNITSVWNNDELVSYKVVRS